MSPEAGYFCLGFWAFSVLSAFLLGHSRGMRPEARANRRQQITAQIEELTKEYEGLGDAK